MIVSIGYEVESLLRVCVGGVLLIIAAIMDMREREISDVVWLIMVIASGVFLLIDIILNEFSPPHMLLSLGFGVVMGAVLYFLRFGGADIKALLGIALLYPRYPVFGEFPLFGVPPVEVFVMSVLTNTVISGLSAPLWLFVKNALRRNFSPLMFMGIKVPADSLRHRRHFRLMHSFDGSYVCGGVEVTEDDIRKIENLHREGIIEEVWITPELPFIVFIAFGFFTAFILGDIIVILF